MRRPHRQHLVRRHVKNQGIKVFLRCGKKFRKDPKKRVSKKK